MLMLSVAPQANWSFWDWVSYFVSTKYPDFLMGAGNTLLISIIGTIVGLVIGLLIGVVRTMPVTPNDSLLKRGILKVSKIILQVYIEIFRGTPMIVQAMVFFYGIAQAFQIFLPTLLAGIIIVSINTGAYMSEIVRGGIESINKGQREAAHTIGMTHMQTMIHVILPQTIRNILPATGNEFVINIKDTSVLSVISVTELFFVSKSIAGTFYAYFQTMTITCAVYFVLTFTVTRILRAIEKKIDGPSSYTIQQAPALAFTMEVEKEGEPLV